MQKMRFSLPFFIALVLMLCTYTYKIGDIYNYRPKSIEKVLGSDVLGAETESKDPILNADTIYIPPVQDFSAESTDTAVETKEVIRNTNGTFTEIVKTVSGDNTIMTVTEREPTGEVIKETIYPLK